MKYLKPFNESNEIDIVYNNIRDIFMELNDDGIVKLYTHKYNNTIIVQIQGTKFIPHSDHRKRKVLSSSDISDEYERVIQYLGDKLLSVSMTYNEAPWSKSILFEPEYDPNIDDKYQLPDNFFEINITMNLYGE